MLRIIGPSLICLACTAAIAAAEPVNSVSAAYNVDVGPMTMMVVKYQMNLADAGVRSAAQIKSHGISRVFAEYTAKAESESRAKGSAITPVSFRYERQKDDRKREARLQWNDGGGVTYAPQEKEPERRAKIAEALSDLVADPMTAVLRIGTAGETPCPSTQQIFDGRDVYELSLSDKGRGQIKDGEGYNGPVQLCEVSWTPIAGRAAEKNEPRDTYDVSFAAVGELPSGRTLWLPVALSGRLKGLRFNAYVTKLRPGQL